MAAQRPEAILLAVGRELVTGEIVDTNSSRIAARLAAAGIATREVRLIDDDRDEIAAAIRAALARAPVVIVGGGLGPTDDDLTRAGVAQAAGVPLVEHPQARASLEAYLARAGRRLNPAQAPQMMAPAAAQILANSVGTAPGFLLACDGGWIAVVPGVPRELDAMLEPLVVELAARLGLDAGARIVGARRFGVCGMFESRIGELVRGIDHDVPGLSWGTNAHAGTVDVILRAAGAPAEVAALLEAGRRALATRLGAHIYGEGVTLAGAILARLAARGETLAVAESCTGGVVAAALTAEPGASRAFLLGAVTYANQAKVDLLGVDPALIAAHGAVSQPVAQAMADGVAARAGATWGLATTGIAGPDGGTATKPVGTIHIALARRDGAVREHRELLLPPCARTLMQARGRDALLALLWDRVQRLTADAVQP